MEKIIKVKVLNGYQLFVAFDDGTQGEIDLSDRLLVPCLNLSGTPKYFPKLGLMNSAPSAGPMVLIWRHDALYQQLLDQRQVRNTN